MYCSVCGTQVLDTDQFCPRCGRVMSAASPAAYAAQPGTVGRPYFGPRYGGFWLRLVAHLLDGLIIGIPTGAIFLAIFFGFGGVAWIHAHIPDNMDSDQAAAHFMDFFGALMGFYALLFLAGIAISWMYYALMESSERQATLGKAVLNLKVTDMSGTRISFGRATGRFFSKIVSGFIPFGIGYILAGFTEKKQALHDFMAATLVIRTD
jgi:uncharacterized RDD family membrane protein YckC